MFALCVPLCNSTQSCVLGRLRYTLILCPSRRHGNGQTTPLSLSILPKMLRPKILLPNYSFILSSGTGPVNLRLPQGGDYEHRKAREDMKELLTAKANIDRFLGMEEVHEEPDATKEKEAEQR